MFNDFIRLFFNVIKVIDFKEIILTFWKFNFFLYLLIGAQNIGSL